MWWWGSKTIRFQEEEEEEEEEEEVMRDWETTKSKAIKGRGKREKTNREKRAKVPHLEPIRQKRALQARVKRVGPGALLSGDLFGELDVSDLLFELLLRCLLRLEITLGALNRLLQLVDLRRELLVLLLRNLHEACCHFARHGLGAELKAEHDVEGVQHFVLGNVGPRVFAGFGVLVVAVPNTVLYDLNALGKGRL